MARSSADLGIPITINPLALCWRYSRSARVLKSSRVGSQTRAVTPQFSGRFPGVRAQGRPEIAYHETGWASTKHY